MRPSREEMIEEYANDSFAEDPRPYVRDEARAHVAGERGLFGVARYILWRRKKGYMAPEFIVADSTVKEHLGDRHFQQWSHGPMLEIWRGSTPHAEKWDKSPIVSEDDPRIWTCPATLTPLKYKDVRKLMRMLADCR